MGLPSNHSVRSRLLVIAVAIAIGPASLAPAQDLSRQPTAAEPSNAVTQDKIAAEAPFLKENDAAMTKMMNGMAAKPTGYVDHDFVAMMVPHHQGAIDMAVAYLRFGHSEKLRRLAQEIIVSQQQEIAAMRLAVGEKLPPPVPSPTQIKPVAVDQPISDAAVSAPAN